MAVPKRRQQAPDNHVRGELHRKLSNLKDRLIARYGNVSPIFHRAYGLGRIDDIASGQEVTVSGYEIRPYLYGGHVPPGGVTRSAGISAAQIMPSSAPGWPALLAGRGR